jgi:hypothetical protein
MDGMCQGIEREYQSHYNTAQSLEVEVLSNQREINALKRDLKKKKQTLKTYENFLKQPKGAPIEVFRCKICLKYFANNDYLVTHYKKRHRDFYNQEIREKENQMLMANRELGEANKPFSEDDFMSKLKEEVVDKFSNNFLRLQVDLDQLKKVSKLEAVEAILREQHTVAPLEEVQDTIKTYEIMIEEFKQEVSQ